MKKNTVILGLLLAFIIASVGRGESCILTPEDEKALKKVIFLRRQLAGNFREFRGAFKMLKKTVQSAIGTQRWQAIRDGGDFLGALREIAERETQVPNSGIRGVLEVAAKLESNLEKLSYAEMMLAPGNNAPPCIARRLESRVTTKAALNLLGRSVGTVALAVGAGANAIGGELFDPTAMGDATIHKLRLEEIDDIGQATDEDLMRLEADMHEKIKEYSDVATAKGEIDGNLAELYALIGPAQNSGDFQRLQNILAAIADLMLQSQELETRLTQINAASEIIKQKAAHISALMNSKVGEIGQVSQPLRDQDRKLNYKMGGFDPVRHQFRLSYRSHLDENNNVLASPILREMKFITVPTSMSGLKPIAGSWNGDEMKSVGLYDPRAGRFYLNKVPYEIHDEETGSLMPNDFAFRFGPLETQWIPLAGDWNGDGVDTVGLYNPASSRFYLRNRHEAGTADLVFSFGPSGSGWKPITGDWNGDGVDTMGLYNPVAGIFYLKNSNTGGPADIVFRYGPINSTWLPIAGDWQNDWSNIGIDHLGLYNSLNGSGFLRLHHLPGPADLTVRAAAALYPIVGQWW